MLHCFFLGFTITYLLCLMLCGRGPQHNVDVNHTLCTVYEQRTCLLCMRSKAAHVSVQENMDTLEILSKNLASVINFFLL